MTIQLLPDDFDALITAAVRVFWSNRDSGGEGQGGRRGAVIGGKNLDGFLGVITAVANRCGLPASDVYTKGRKDLTLPGYFRASKNWDALIVHRGRLLAVLEFKSQVGPSFGNNLNNRAEEAIGSGADFWSAAREGALSREEISSEPVVRRALAPVDRVLGNEPESGSDRDPRRPLLGYLMLLEDCAAVHCPVRNQLQHFPVLPDFDNASYATRYRLLCERLMLQRLYTAASLLLTPAPADGAPPSWRSLTEATSPRALFSALAAHLAASVR